MRDDDRNEYWKALDAVVVRSNVSILIRDLSHDTPIFNSAIQLSWNPRKSNVGTPHASCFSSKTELLLKNFDLEIVNRKCLLLFANRCEISDMPLKLKKIQNE